MTSCPPWWEDKPEHLNPLVREAIRGVLTSARQQVRHSIPTWSQIRRWHEDVFRDVVPLHYYAGNNRQDDSARLCLGIDVEVGGNPGAHYRYVASLITVHEQRMHQALTELELGWASRAAQQNVEYLATVIADVVGSFIKIHPFVNGNGRVSRMLWSVLLARRGLPHVYAVIDHPDEPSYDFAMAQAMKGDNSALFLVVCRELSK